MAAYNKFLPAVEKLVEGINVETSKAKAKKIKLVKPDEKISIQRLERDIKSWEMSADLPFILKTFDYQEMYLLSKRIQQMQDEEDLEILLTML